MSTEPQVAYVAIIGIGGVGTAVLSQLEALAHRYLSSPAAPVRVQLIYVSRSSHAVLADASKPISLSDWKSALDASSDPPLPLPKLAEHLKTLEGRAVVVDNTASQQVAESYPVFLEKGISIVTPNKKAFASSLPLWDEIFGAAANGSATKPAEAGFVFHESSVCACMPIVCTLKDLLETGDIVTRIEGVFSGTLAFLFNSFMPVSGASTVFSEEVKKAKELGFTEPDPRDDLNGMDVARKLTILARLAGLRIASPNSFSVQSLIPKELEEVASGDEFIARLHEYDSQIDAVKQEAEAENKVLRYVGEIDFQTQQLEVGLRKFDKSHPIAALKGAQNIVNFYTKRYGELPLTVQGVGAGGESTAMGVTADLNRLFALLR